MLMLQSQVNLYEGANVYKSFNCMWEHYKNYCRLQDHRSSVYFWVAQVFEGCCCLHHHAPPPDHNTFAQVLKLEEKTINRYVISLNFENESSLTPISQITSSGVLQGTSWYEPAFKIENMNKGGGKSLM